MLLQLTSQGRALINAEPVGVQITRVDFGDSFNYAVDDDPTGLDGDIVYVSNTAYQPRIVNTNSIRYTVVLDKTVASVTFGEMALYSGSTLIGVAVSPTQIHKIGPGGGEDGADLRLDVFVDAGGSERYAQVEVVSSRQSNSFPRYSVPDSLQPPAKNQNNAYVIYGQTENDIPYFAFADPTGKWSFSAKPQVYFEGTVESINSLGLQATGLTGSYSGPDTDLVLQFVSGAQRGYCRLLTDVLNTGGFMWNTPLLELPEVGDNFIVLGPQQASAPASAPPALSDRVAQLVTADMTLTASAAANGRPILLVDTTAGNNISISMPLWSAVKATDIEDVMITVKRVGAFNDAVVKIEFATGDLHTSAGNPLPEADTFWLVNIEESVTFYVTANNAVRYVSL